LQLGFAIRAAPRTLAAVESPKEHTMSKRLSCYTAALFSLTMIGTGPAQAMDGEAFSIIFYSDASHTSTIGFARAACNPDPVAILQWGSSSQYQEINYVGQCIDGELYHY
jgi:hypothetical protein